MDTVYYDTMQVLFAIAILIVAFGVASYLRKHFH